MDRQGKGMMAAVSLDRHLHELASRFGVKPYPVTGPTTPARRRRRATVSPVTDLGGPLPGLAEMGFCRVCGRVLVDALRHHGAGYAFTSTCGDCYEWPTSNRVDHQAWVAARRGRPS